MLLLFRSTFFYMKPIVLGGLNCTHPNYKSCSFQLQDMLLSIVISDHYCHLLHLSSRYPSLSLYIHNSRVLGWREEKNVL